MYFFMAAFFIDIIHIIDIYIYIIILFIHLKKVQDFNEHMIECHFWKIFFFFFFKKGIFARFHLKN